MNEYDIEDAVRQFSNTDTPNLLAGATTLLRLMQWTNRNSDGWPYWTKPTTAARKLMELLQNADRFDPVDVTDAELKRAYTPIKAFLTKQGADHELVFPTPIPPEKPVTISVPVVLRIIVPAGRVDDARQRVASYIEYGSVRDGLSTAFEEVDYEIALDALYVPEDLS